MITIDQLLESVDLDFEPRWVTKEPSGAIAMWAEKPEIIAKHRVWIGQTDFVVIHLIKLAEFDGKDWQECIYEVPRKTTGKIEKLVPLDGLQHNWLDKINELVDAVNELKGANNE